MGYPTQKPVGLLNRIITTSSDPGQVVLDPFCGCGTAVVAAQYLGRQWLGIDITHLAIAMHKSRLKGMYDLTPGKNYDVVGEPQDLESAKQLAHDDRYQFQWWASSLVQARPLGGGDDGRGKKGKDAGIDAIIPYIEDTSGNLKRVVVQVKSGHVKSGDIRDLRGALDREKDASIAVFITLEKPTADMIKEAASAGKYRSIGWNAEYPCIQILTIADLLAGARVQMPPNYGTFKRAERVKKVEGVQPELGFDSPTEE